MTDPGSLGPLINRDQPSEPSDDKCRFVLNCRCLFKLCVGRSRVDSPSDSHSRPIRPHLPAVECIHARPHGFQAPITPRTTPAGPPSTGVVGRVALFLTASGWP